MLELNLLKTRTFFFKMGIASGWIANITKKIELKIGKIKIKRKLNCKIFK